MKTYLVGGTVRDLLLNQILGMQQPANDRDWLIVGSTEDELINKGFQRVGKSFPIFLHPTSKEEYALARTQDNNFCPHVTLEEDLGRRDFSINAMAMTPSGQLRDPHNGLSDIKSQILRHIELAFDNDPLRILRLARFAAYLPSFSIAPETIAAARHFEQQDLLQLIAPERAFKELHKALAAPAPQRFIQVLRECKVLKQLMPEVDGLYGIPQPEKYHPEIDTGKHTELCMQQAARIAPGNPLVGFAALVHDLGKGVTPKHILPSHRGHEKAGVPLVDTFCQRLAVPNRYRDFARLVTEYHLHMHKLTELRPSTVVKMLDALKAFKNPAQVERFALACEADSRGRQGKSNIEYPQTEILINYYESARIITSKQLLENGHQPGPALGEALRRARARAILNVRNNNTS